MPPLVMSPELGSAAPEAARVHHTACPLDCPDACGLEVEVEDGRVTRVAASDAHSYTAGFICAKVGHFARHMYGPERLLQPGLRSGPKGEGRFEALSWEGAFELLAGKVREVMAQWGGEAILPLSYGGSNGLFTQDTTDARLFRRLGASRLARTVCAAPTKVAAAGLYGRMAGVPLADYVHARLIVVWGVNPSATGIHFVPVVQAARRAGARLVVIDPRRTPLAAKADLHLAPRPGTDLPLALAVIHWLFAEGRADLAFLDAHATGAEELRRRAAAWPLARAAEVCGLEAAEIERFARLYAESSPVAIRCGWGLERNRNGGSAVAAVLALPAVAGKFGVRGGGYTMSNSGAYRGVDNERAIAALEAPTRTVNMNLVGRTLLAAGDPPVQLLFVYNANPLATLPNQELVRQGLAREDLFTVVFDQVMTDTARYADLVLPATTFLEHEELSRGYGALVVQRAAPVVAPVGEARGNVEVFAELCRRLGLARPDDPTTPDELAAAILPDRLRGELAGPGTALPDCGPSPVQFVDVFPNTPDQKIRLVPEALDREAPGGLYAFRADPATARFPLALISPATHHTVSSTFGQLRRGKAALEIHPADAASRDLADGDPVRVWNELGEVRCAVRVTADLRPGTVLLPKGLWSHHTASGTTANALAPDTLTDLGGGACFNDARVEVERV